MWHLRKSFQAASLLVATAVHTNGRSGRAGRETADDGIDIGPENVHVSFGGERVGAMYRDPSELLTALEKSWRDAGPGTVSVQRKAEDAVNVLGSKVEDLDLCHIALQRLVDVVLL
jgi:hypothetical protein